MEQVAVNLISSVLRIRQIDPKQVEALKASIAEVGLLNPLTVYRAKIVANGGEVDGYRLVAGAHRLEAIRRLGWTEVPAQIVELDELHRTIAECDENLCGTNLTPAERAELTRHRQCAYEKLHPETVLGANQHTRVRQLGESVSSRFTKETAERIGKSERAVQRDAERGAKVCATALQLVKNSPGLNTGAYLDKLKDMPVAAQIRKVKADLVDAPKPRLVTADDKIKRQVAALMDVWDRSSDEARAEFLRRIQVKAA